MKLIDTVIERIDYLGDTRAAHILAQALYSACRHDSFPAPSILTASSALDAGNRALMAQLINITTEPDYSNADQDRARAHIELAFGDSITAWRHGLEAA